jgi:hypothetical protein
MGFSTKFEEEVIGLDKEYVDHMGVENVVREMIERNLEDLGDESMDQTELFKAIGFSERGAAQFSDFIDDSITHLSFANWLDLFLEKVFSPKGDITASKFPFHEEIVDRLFNCSLGEDGNNLAMINFESKGSLDDWIREQNDPGRNHRLLQEGKK